MPHHRVPMLLSQVWWREVEIHRRAGGQAHILLLIALLTLLHDPAHAALERVELEFHPIVLVALPLGHDRRR